MNLRGAKQKMRTSMLDSFESDRRMRAHREADAEQDLEVQKRAIDTLEHLAPNLVGEAALVAVGPYPNGVPVSCNGQTDLERLADWYERESPMNVIVQFNGLGASLRVAGIDRAKLAATKMRVIVVLVPDEVVELVPERDR